MLQKHFTMLLTDKIRPCHSAHRERAQTFRIWVDPLPSSYDKAAKIVLHRMNRAVLPEDRRQDVLGDLHWAVMSAWEGKAAASHKLAVRDAVARHLGWDDLRADTDQRERKFNVWVFHGPARTRRTARRREARLLHPLPSRRLASTGRHDHSQRAR